MQRGHLTADGSLAEGAPEQPVQQDELSAVKAGAWLGEAMTEAETLSARN